MTLIERVYKLEEMKRLSNLQAKEEKIQLLNWVIQVIGSGQSYQQIRQVIHKKLEDIKAGK